ncbi:MAG TPA: DUF6152 family protein [Vicinamibacterales bacterium]|nr:DUF6152 family protein [Vicinamibacterales bacterium]
MRKPIAWPVLIAVVIAAASLSAHHSFVVFFDDEKIIEVSGIVTDFRFTNPHAIISLSAKNKQGQVESWRAETNAVTLLRRRGWTKDSLTVGEAITIEGWPARDGSNYMRMRKVTRADGTVLGTAVTNQRVDQ